MPTYITLVKFTDEGIKIIKESPQHVEGAKQAFSAAGGRMTAFYLVLGEYDAVVISEFPDDAVAATTFLAIASGGTARTTTLKAFTEEEYRRIIAAMP